MEVETVNVISATSGNLLPAVKIRESKIRKFFMLPWVFVGYIGTGLKGPCVCKRWYNPQDIIW